jgi:hypothetical protein
VCAKRNTNPAHPFLWHRPAFGRGGEFGVLLDSGAESETIPDQVLVEAKRKAEEAVSHLRLVFRFVSKKTKQIPN